MSAIPRSIPVSRPVLVTMDMERAHLLGLRIFREMMKGRLNAFEVRRQFEKIITSASTDPEAAEAEVLELFPSKEAFMRKHGITERESNILDLLAEGMGNAEIARRIFVAQQTVKFHLSNVYRKLGVRNRTQATIVWKEL